MKKVLIILFGLVSLAALGQEVVMPDSMVTDSVEVSDVLPYPAILEDMSNVIVHQDSMITLLMQEKIAGISREQKEIQGWRVQIYSSNNQKVAKSEAMAIQQLMQSQLDVNMYVLYNPPFWKVRIGDFRTMEEAQEYKKTFLEMHPEMQGNTYVVRDEHVQLRK